jgi:hypothetical protein
MNKTTNEILHDIFGAPCGNISIEYSQRNHQLLSGEFVSSWSVACIKFEMLMKDSNPKLTIGDFGSVRIEEVTMSMVHHFFANLECRGVLLHGKETNDILRSLSL